VKTALVIGGFLLIGIALADLAAGNSDHPILPAFVGNQLSQQGDLLALAVGGGALFYGYTQL